MSNMTPAEFGIAASRVATAAGPRPVRGNTWLAVVASTTGRHLRNLGPFRIILRLALIGTAALVISGIGHILFQPARNEGTETARFVGSLTDQRATLTKVPLGLDSKLGYSPVAVDGNLADPEGGCSTPGGIGPADFTTACRTHDLGYDLLRVAEADGERLGAWARFDLDLLLYKDMVKTCETATCRTTAAVYYTGVTANSIRQGYRAPSEEPTLPWFGVGAIVIGLALLPPVHLLHLVKRYQTQPDRISGVLVDMSIEYARAYAAERQAHAQARRLWRESVGTGRRVSQRPVRNAIGHGLIRVGERLAGPAIG